MKNISAILFGIFISVSHVKAQNKGFETILFALEDNDQLISAYIRPAISGFTYGMNNGWYHTAKAHKPFGFDLTIGMNASGIPSKDKIFSFADLDLSNNTSYGSPIAATIGGSEDLETPITFSTIIEGQNVSTTFNMPGGVLEKFPLNSLPTPSIQFSVGFPGKIDAIVRLVPQIGVDQVKGSLTGIGLKKEITDWFGGMKKTPAHLSLLASYTTANADYEIQKSSSIGGMDQRAEFRFFTYNIEAIASLNFPVIIIFGGIGYSSGNSSLNLLGTYFLEYDTGFNAPNNTLTQIVEDPLELDFNTSSFKTTAGIRVNLGFFKLYGSYTLQDYNTIGAGIAFNFR